MKNNLLIKFIFFVLSYFIVAFSQPAWIGFLGYLAAFLGYLLFWFSISDLKSNKLKFILSFVWFFLIQSIQLSWMTSTKYQGKLILIVYFFILAWFAIEFAIISYIALKEKVLTFSKIFFIASIWVIFEWSRLFFMCGFSFNQIGSAYANNHFSMQLVAIFGIFGLSFYVILVNLSGLKAVLEKSFKTYVLWIILAIFPYIYGYFHEKIYEKKFDDSKKIKVCLVQTAILPEQKILTKNHFDDFISPILQWKRILNLINKESFQKVDLIVLPEAAIPYSAHDHFYPFDIVQDLFSKKFGREIIDDLPQLKQPYAKNYDGIWYVSNSFFAKALANIYNSEVAIGLDDYDENLDKSYNSAFYFHPDIDKTYRYDKQILVPMGEYIPCSWLGKIALKKYGISSSFTHGNEAKIFSEKNAFSFSICYEETYPNIMRRARLKGAKCFVNLTNDAYFYKSKLFKQHFDHAKLRAVENGAPLIRACNTGISASIDSFGRTIDAIYSEDTASAIFIKTPMFSYKTLYTLWGDYLILLFAVVIIFSYVIKTSRKIKNL